MNDPLVSMFWENVPRKFVERLLRVLLAAYPSSVTACEERHDHPEAENLIPLERRAIIEGNMRRAASAFPDEIVARAVRDPRSNWWNHTRIECGRVAITESTVADPDELVRPALHREMYAARNPQRLLFEDFEQPEPLPDSVLYGILIHGRDRDDSSRLGFAVIRFPSRDLTSYLSERIDLFLEFPNVVAESMPHFEDASDEERIDELPDLELKDDTDIGEVG